MKLVISSSGCVPRFRTHPSARVYILGIKINRRYRKEQRGSLFGESFNNRRYVREMRKINFTYEEKRVSWSRIYSNIFDRVKPRASCKTIREVK